MTSIVVVLLGILSLQNVQGQEGDPLIQPPIIDSAGGELDITLSLEYADHNGPFYSLTNTRLLNGTLPGPTVRIQAGDTVKVLFKNLLQQQAGTTFGINEFTKPDHANLHFHGGHVSGELPSDDVRYVIAPGDSYQYETKFPDNHMPGTHWIHPHAHGSASIQVGGGAALAMIVKDPVGYLPAQVADAQDVLVFIQHLNFRDLNTLINNHNDGIFSANLDAGFPINVQLVNGQVQPVVSMQPGEWQRWRVVMAGWLGFQLNFQIPSTNCEMQLLAKDGIYIRDFPRAVNMLPLAPGGRADVMVRCSQAGTYDVVNLVGVPIMTISVAGEAVDPSVDLKSWTPEYPDYLSDLRSVSVSTGCSCVTDFEDCDGGGNFGGGGGGGLGLGDDPVCINGELFDEHVYLHTVAFGSVVERDLRDVDDHPYHQHVYAYQVIALNNLRNADHAAYYQLGDWQDVVMIDARSVIIRYRADVHTGTVMVHCHTLPHEDKGTMTQELVIDGGECDCSAFYVQPPTVSIPLTSNPTFPKPVPSPTTVPKPVPSPTTVPKPVPRPTPKFLQPTGAPQLPGGTPSDSPITDAPTAKNQADGANTQIPTVSSEGAAVVNPTSSSKIVSIHVSLTLILLFHIF